jgi:hypothetical protein
MAVSFTSEAAREGEPEVFSWAPWRSGWSHIRRDDDQTATDSARLVPEA